MILVEKLDQRSDLAGVLREWLRGLAEDAGCGDVHVDETEDGWMLLEVENEVLMASIIRIQTRINPIVSDKPPFPVRILRLGETTIKAEYPDLEGKTVQKSFPLELFAACLGYGGEDSRSFLEAAGFVEGSVISISAGLPSFTQLKLTREYLLRGLDRLLVLNAAPQEVRAVLESQEITNLIAEMGALTLSTHVLYVRLGVTLDKALRKLVEVFNTVSDDIEVKPLPWKNLLGLRIRISEGGRGRI